MNSPFVNAYVKILRTSDHYRLSAIVEMANLPEARRESLTDFYNGRCWPLLRQAQFHNLRAVGPWLFGARPGSGVSAQYDFQSQLQQSAHGAVRSWIISALPPEQLVHHLSQANSVIGPDGHSYLLRYHTPEALLALSARPELQGVSEWLAPIHYWWALVAHPQSLAWQQITGGNQPQAIQVPPITLDEACWTSLAGDPLSYRLAEMLKHEPSLTQCTGSRRGLIQYYLNQAREQGLSREDDLSTFVLLMSRNGKQLAKNQGWQDALATTCAEQSPLADNVQACLRTLS